MNDNNNSRGNIQKLNWPQTPYFTIEDVQALNPGVINVTLRSWITKKIEENIISAIGHKYGGNGRPKKVFSFNPVTKETLMLVQSQSQSNNVMLDGQDEFKKMPDIVTLKTVQSNPESIIA